MGRADEATQQFGVTDAVPAARRCADPNVFVRVAVAERKKLRNRCSTN
jgi:hypothetical protein